MTINSTVMVAGFRSEEDANYKGASYGWQRFIGSLERVVGRVD